MLKFFITIVDKVENLDNKNNKVINYHSNIISNIYMNGINIYEINSNLTYIYLGKCEENLKNHYKLDSNENLYIATFETLNNIENRVTNQSIFRIYLKNGHI